MQQDQNYGIKELYEVVLKAKTPMMFGSRYIEADEPVLYFENINMAVLSEQSNPIMARGGWSNMPRVIWEDRSEVQFSLKQGVMTSAGLSILLSSSVLENEQGNTILVPKREGPYGLDENGYMYLQHWPVKSDVKKTFLFSFSRDVAQKKVYGKRIRGQISSLTGQEKPCIALYEDKECTIPADKMSEYIADYYYEYKENALIYLIQKERFNGLFTLEGKFYSKDETEGLNYTNLIYMPKVRIVSDINLRLGERADPTTSVFNIIGMPERTDESKNLILKVTRLSTDIDAEL